MEIADWINVAAGLAGGSTITAVGNYLIQRRRTENRIELDNRKVEHDQENNVLAQWRIISEASKQELALIREDIAKLRDEHEGCMRREAKLRGECARLEGKTSVLVMLVMQLPFLQRAGMTKEESDNAAAQVAKLLDGLKKESEEWERAREREHAAQEKGE